MTKHPLSKVLLLISQTETDTAAITLGECAVRALEMEDLLFAMGAMLHPPCFCCGYNGEGYYQIAKHPCALRHHLQLEKEGGNDRI